MSVYSSFTLAELATKALLKHKYVFLSVDSSEIISLRQVLSVSQCQSILKYCTDMLFQQAFEEEASRKLDVRRILEIFRDISSTKLYSANLKGHIKDNEIFWIVQHPLKHLDVSDAIGLNNNALHAINEYCMHLKSLIVGSAINFGSVDVVDYRRFRKNYFNPFGSISDENVERLQLRFGEDYLFDCPQLERVSVTISSPEAPEFVAALISRCPNLTHLALEDSDIDVDFMDCIEYVPRLTYLDLHNVKMESCMATFTILKQLKQLRHLDISVAEDSPVLYEDAEGSLLFLLENLPTLQSLDISGTNLLYNDSKNTRSLEPWQAATSNTLDCSQEKGNSSPFVVPLVKDSSRSCWLYISDKHPMKFLGLLDCASDPCFDPIPVAEEISGLADERQIMSCLKRYKRRPLLINKALNALFLKVRREGTSATLEILTEILDILLINKTSLFTLIPATASLFYVVRECRDRGTLNTILRKNIIRIVVTILEEQLADVTVLRNGVLILHIFVDPEQFLFICRRLVKLIVTTLRRPMVGEAFVERYFLHVLNGLACNLEVDCKAILGDLGVVECLLDVIRRLAENRHSGDVLEYCWSILWNVTDETPANCERFLKAGGLEAFARCFDSFYNIDLYRNMTGLIGNVAEVHQLRDQLRSPLCLKILDLFVDHPDESLEVSYNTIGILAHLMFDGFAGFAEASIEPDVCCERIFRVVTERWKIDSIRQINYRSFVPILRLVPCSYCPIVQLWSVWALANLTTSNHEKYLAMLERDGGIRLLIDLIKETDDEQYEAAVRQHNGTFHSWRSARVLSKKLAADILQNLEKYKTENIQPPSSAIVLES